MIVWMVGNSISMKENVILKIYKSLTKLHVEFPLSVVAVEYIDCFFSEG